MKRQTVLVGGGLLGLAILGLISIRVLYFGPESRLSTGAPPHPSEKDSHLQQGLEGGRPGPAAAHQPRSLVEELLAAGEAVRPGAFKEVQVPRPSIYRVVDQQGRPVAKPGETVKGVQRILLEGDTFQIRETLVRGVSRPYRLLERIERPGQSGEKVLQREEMALGQVLLQLEGDRAQAELRLAKLGLKAARSCGGSGAVVASLPEGLRVEQALALVRAAGIARYVEPDWLVHTTVDLPIIPNDPDFSKLWGLHNTGQTGGKSDADIDAPEAWNITKGSSSMVVAVIDTGVDYTHPDLAPNMWTNLAEKNGLPGVDDDGDGLVDDIYGYDYVNRDGDPKDDNLHGTHVAGTIGAAGNNGTGVAGVCWNVRLMALKFLDSGGSGYTSDAVSCVDFARTHGAKVMSNSWGGGGFSQALYDAINAANGAGILFVAAAGNSANDNDGSPSYPSNYAVPNVVSVAATDHNDALASFSSYGATTVHLGAPGVGIYSTFPTYQTAEMLSRGWPSNYYSISGTSMATPHVSGAAALLLAVAPTLTPADLRSRLIQRVDPVPALMGKAASNGRLNVYNLLNSGWQPAPANTVLKGMTLSDTGGNGNGYPEPGETVKLSPTFLNSGQVGALGVTATLTSGDTRVSISDGSEAVGTVPAFGSVLKANAFTVAISAAAGDTGPVVFNLRIQDSAGHLSDNAYKFYITHPQPKSFVAVNFAPGELTADPARNLVYVIDLTNQRILAVSMDTGRTVAWSALAGSAHILAPVSTNTPMSGYSAVSRDGTRLYVALTVSKKIQVFSLPDLSSLAVYSYLFEPISLACDAEQRLYASSHDNSGPIRQISTENGAVLHEFGGYYMGAMLRTDSAGRRLFVGETGLRRVGGPGSIDEYDLAAQVPVLAKSHPYWMVYLADYTVNEGLRRIYTMNGGIYAVQVTEMDSGRFGEEWPMGAPYGSVVQMLQGSPYVYAAVPGTYDSHDVRKFLCQDGTPVADYLLRPPASAGYYANQSSFKSRHLRLAANGRQLGVKNSWTGSSTTGIDGTLYWMVALGLSDLKIEGYPTASFTALPASGPAPLAVTFNGSASQGSLTSYSWDFGDGGTATGSSATHTYLQPGRYKAVLTVRTGDGLADTESAWISVSGPNNPPVIALGPVATPNPSFVWGSVSFSVSASDPDGDPLSYAWEFGDGDQATGRMVSHSYRSAGSYAPRVTVSDGRGGAVSATVSVTVMEHPDDRQDTDWRTHGKDPSHSSYYPANLAGGAFLSQWQAALGSAALQPVAAAGERVYVAPSSGPSFVAALDASTGSTVWRSDFGAASDSSPPTFDSGRIYFQRSNHSPDCQVHCLDAATGNSLWVAPFEDQWSKHYAPAVYGSNVYLNAGYYGGLAGFDKLTGQARFFVGLPQTDAWTPVCAGGRIYTWVANVYSGGFSEHSPSYGGSLWSLNVGGRGRDMYSMHTVPALAGGRAFLLNMNLCCVDVATRTKIWQVDGAFSGSPAVANGLVYVLSGQTVKAYSASTGSLVRTYQADTALQFLPIVANDTLIAASATKTYIFDLGSANLRQTISSGGYLGLANNRLFIATGSGVLKAFQLGGTPNARIGVAPASLLVSGALGQKSTRNLVLQNTGNVDLVWSIPATPAWLAAAPTAGRISAGESATVTLLFDPDVTGLGTFATNLHLLSNDAGQPDLAVPITFQVEQVSLLVSTAGTGTGRVVLNPPGGVYPPGTAVTLTATANPGSSFSKWFGNLSGTANPATLTMDGVKNVTAIFDLSTYWLLATAGTGATISPQGSVFVTGGGSQSFSIGASAGFAVTGVTVDGAPVGPVSSYTFSNVTADHVIHASAAPVPRQVVYGWGNNVYGQVGDGTVAMRSTPVAVANLDANIRGLAGGGNHGLVARPDGTVRAWGWNAFGQLGDGTVVDRYWPGYVPGLGSVSAVACGGSHSLALKADGTVWAWGKNWYGQLGDGTTTNRSAPVQVSGLANVVAVSGGGDQSLALKADGTVWAWGYNNYGQLGDGTTTNRSIPVQIPGLSGVTSIAGCFYHNLALLADGTVRAWGYNTYGQLGNGTTVTSKVPVQVSGLSGVRALAGGALYHSLALRSDGTVSAWGYNGSGQLGDGTTTHRSTPVQVSGLSGVGAIVAGGMHSLALKTGGTVWAWGYNNYGQLGDGTTTTRLAPIQVAGLDGVQALAAGMYHSHALLKDNSQPVIDSGPTAVPNPVQAGSPVAFAVSASDANGDVLTYAWSFGDGFDGSGPAPAHAYTSVGTYSATVTVTDGRGGTAAGTVVVTVLPPNRPPVADAQAVSTSEDTAKGIALTGSDPDGNPLTFAVLSGPAHGTLSGSAPNLTYLPAANYFGSDSFSFKVNDGSLDSAPATVSLTVLAVNDVPQAILTGPAPGARFVAPASIALAASASDVDGTVTKVEFYNGTALLGQDLTAPYTFTWGNVAAGSYSLTVKATDNLGLATVSAPVVVKVVPVVSASVSDAWAAEPSADTGRFLISRTSSTAAALTVGYTLSGTALGGTDYQALPGSVVIPAGSSSVYVYVTPVDDTLVEGKESVVLTLRTSTEYSLGTSVSGTVTLLDNEQPVITASVADAWAAEPGLDTGRFTIFRTGATTAALTVSYALSGTALNGTDYTLLSGSATIPAGAASTTVTINPTDDTLLENRETVTLTVTGGSGYQTGAAVSGTLYLLDDEMPILNVSVADGIAAEPADAGVYTITRSGKLDTAVTVLYTMSGTAGKGTDYATPSGTLTLAAGEASATVTLAPLDDTLVEGKEYAYLNLSANSAYQTGAVTSAYIYLWDDEKPEVKLAVTDSAASESGLDTGAFRVSCFPAAKGALVVRYAVAGTATNGVDYAALSGSVTIAAGADSAAIVVSPVDDLVGELSETVAATLISDAAYQNGSPASGTVSIADNEPVASIAAVDAAAAETTAPALANPGTFRISRTGSTAAALVVGYTVAGTATGGVDYPALSGTATIPAGQSYLNVAVNPVDDTAVEGLETVVLTLSAGNGYRVGTASATVSLGDND